MESTGCQAHSGGRGLVNRSSLREKVNGVRIVSKFIFFLPSFVILNIRSRLGTHDFLLENNLKSKEMPKEINANSKIV